jgi:hypothetical protein
MKVRQIRQRVKTKYVSEGGFKFVRDCTGKRCRTYELGCAICDGWRFRDEHGRFVYNWEELRQYINKLENERVEKLIQEARGLTNVR